MIKKVVFLSNYFNHHQKFLSDEFFKLLGDGYTFIETIPMEKERKNLGWKEYYEPYLLKAYLSDTNYSNAMQLIEDADLLIVGSANERFIKTRIEKGKLIFRYSERPLKNVCDRFKLPLYTLKYNSRNPKNKPIYLLCSSAYTSADFKKMGLFKQKAFKWGYFPETKTYKNIDNLLDSKIKNSVLWCGRFIKWKHLEDALNAIKIIIDKGYDITFNIVGDGELKNQMIDLSKKLSIDKNVVFVGSLESDKVREYMEKSSIYLCTSDFQEGWGAVLNESMNSGCAVICSHAVGAAPFLVNDGINGLLYTSHNVNELTECLETLLKNPDIVKKMGKEAYNTIVKEWSPSVAVKRLLEVANSILKRETFYYESGPCSKAAILKNNWYKRSK